LTKIGLMTNVVVMQEPELLTTEIEPLTTAEVAEELGCSVKTVTRLVEDGKLTALRKLPGLRATYLFERAEIERAKTARAAAPASASP